MVSVKAVAAYLIRKMSKLGAGDEELSGNNDLTNLKLQKVLYFVQVEHLKKTGQPLFKENIEAWRYGPVVREVYNWLKEFGAYVISDFDVDTSAAELLPEDKASFLDDMLEKYQKYSAWGLVEKTHEADSPWSKVFENGRGEGEVIGLDLLRSAETM